MISLIDVENLLQMWPSPSASRPDYKGVAEGRWLPLWPQLFLLTPSWFTLFTLLIPLLISKLSSAGFYCRLTTRGSWDYWSTYALWPKQLPGCWPPQWGTATVVLSDCWGTCRFISLSYWFCSSSEPWLIHPPFIPHFFLCEEFIVLRFGLGSPS